MIICLLKKEEWFPWDLPGGPVARTLSSIAGGLGSVLGQGMRVL